MLKKSYLAYGLFFVIAIILILVYRHSQPPSEDDVFSQNLYSAPIEEVYLIDQSYGEWVTFFEMNHSFHISKLEKDWLGNWKLVHWDGEPGFIGGAAMDLSNNDGVILGASSITNDHENKHTSFYYGMIANSKVDQIKLEKKEWTDKNVALIETERYRFFFYVAYDRLDPFSLQALSNGEVIQQFGGGIPD